LTPTVYNLLLAVLAPLAVPLLALRALAKGQSPETLLEKFGRLPAPFHQTRPGAVWLHAVSVGEAQSAAPLLGELRRAFPEQKIFLSVSTPTGRAVAEEKLAALVDGVFSTPYDFAWAVRAALRALRPGLLIVLETEIWPNLYRETRRAGAGLLLANARMSDRSAPKYARRRGFFGAVLRLCDAVLVQSPEDEERFVAAGADPESVSVAGNLKYDFDAAASPPAAEIRSFAEAASQVVLAGSTREDEEGPVARAFLAAADEQSLLIVAPRHPHRFGEAAEALEEAGLTVFRRSELSMDSVPSLGGPTALLVDTLGELSGLYPLADLVFVGGSLNGWGGHNVLEPALCGKPIVVGPDMQNFREIADTLLAAGGLVQTPDAESLPGAFRRLLEDPVLATQQGQDALCAAEAQRGAARRIADRALVAWNEAAPREPISGFRRVALSRLALLWRLGDRLNQSFTQPRFVDRPVVSVGNLSVGGTGKTPVVLWLCERLERTGRLPAVLTRGYRRRSREPWVVASPGEPASATELGDEAALLHRRLEACGSMTPVGVGGDRAAAAAAVMRKHPETEVFVLDDGFQHYRLARRFDLVLIDVTHPPDADALLPVGRLRQTPDALAAADAVLLTRTKKSFGYESLIRRLGIREPTFRSRMRPTELVSGDARDFGESSELSELRAKAVYAFAGVGSPGAFFSQLESLGAVPAGRRAFPDHYRYSAEDWWRLAADARACRADLLVTTEKDLSNLEAALPAAERSGAPPLRLLRIELEVDEEDALLALIEGEIDS